VFNLAYEAKSAWCGCCSVVICSRDVVDADRVSDYGPKLVDIDADTLGILDTDYEACVTMLSAEFARIVRDLSGLGESVEVEVRREVRERW